MLRGIFSRRKAPPEGRLTVIGVRHHSPACARQVETVIRQLRPRHVLIEGPSDFNPHLADLRLPHDLPIAIFSYHAGGTQSLASYTPFCRFSPEWRALSLAWEIGATPLFCDLPAWHPDFGARSNRYADPQGQRAETASRALAQAMGADGQDALWDALAEQAPPDELAARLDLYFNLLRPDGAEDPAEAAREDHMAAWAAWALAQSPADRVVLVCGGWHAEAIRRRVPDCDGAAPELPQPAADGRSGSYLVPYDYPRLDRLSGYAAGMPSPGYYDTLAQSGPETAADSAFDAITAALRKAGQVISTADRIAWQAHAAGLARARGHAAILRSDLLDAALACLIKEALDRPAPWYLPDSNPHPALRVMLRVLCGHRRGQLAPGTRLPPLVADLAACMATQDVTPAATRRQIVLDWSRPGIPARAHLLHRMRLLDLPGIDRVTGPPLPGTTAPTEQFHLIRHRDFEGAVIEAARWGGDVQMAAASCLADRIAAAGADLAALTLCLADALYADLLPCAPDLAARIAQGVAAARNLTDLARVGLPALRLHRYGTTFGPQAQHALAQVCTAVFARALWLIEGAQPEGPGAVPTLIACRDMLRDLPDLPLDRGAMLSALRRAALGTAAGPVLAGAALGTLIACGQDPLTGIAARLSAHADPDRLGDFLIGLFALAREDLPTDMPLLEALRALVATWDEHEFLVALPALRQAFDWFPPREREGLARALLQAHGLGQAEAEMQAMAWMRQPAPIRTQADAMAQEARLALRLAKAGLT